LRADPRTRESLHRLQQLDGRLRELAACLVPTAAELGEYQTCISDREGLWRSMPMEEDPEVLAFIRATGESGASLRLLTPRVIEWLEAQGLLDAYVVHSRS
jgi:hypothetical protein